MFGGLSFIRLDSADSLVTLKASGSALIAKSDRMDDLAVTVQFECYFHAFDYYDGYSQLLQLLPSLLLPCTKSACSKSKLNCKERKKRLRKQKLRKWLP